MKSSGGLYVTGNTTPQVLSHTPAQLDLDWTAYGNQHGDVSVTEDGTNGELTVLPGRYLVMASLTVETEDISGTSGDDAGNVSFMVYQDGAAVTGIKQTINLQDSDRPTNVTLVGIVEVDAGETGDLELWGSATDASGNDITISEAQFVAYKIS